MVQYTEDPTTMQTSSQVIVHNFVLLIHILLTLYISLFPGNNTSAHDRDEARKTPDTDQPGAEIQQQPADRLVSSVLTLSNSSQTSKVPPTSLTSDTNTGSGSHKKTSPPPTSQPAALSPDSLPTNSTLPIKKTSVSSDSTTVLQHQSSATSNSSKADSITDSVFAGSSACVNKVMGNSTESVANVEPTVTSADMNGSVHDRVSGIATKTDRSSLVRPQTLAVGRQRSEDDMEHMQEVADDLVAKLMDEEEGQEKLMTSLQQTSAAEKWYYRDPQGEVQGGFHPV